LFLKIILLTKNIFVLKILVLKAFEPNDFCSVEIFEMIFLTEWHIHHSLFPPH